MENRFLPLVLTPSVLLRQQIHPSVGESNPSTVNVREGMGEGKGVSLAKAVTSEQEETGWKDKAGITPPRITNFPLREHPAYTWGVRAVALGKKGSLWGEKQHPQKCEIQGKSRATATCRMKIWSCGLHQSASSLYSWVEFILKVVNCLGAESCLCW